MDTKLLIQTNDYLILPLYLLVIYILARRKCKKNIEETPAYKYYIPALFVRIAAGIAFCFVYIYHYGGGDTTNYFQGGMALYKMAHYNIEGFFYILINGLTENRTHRFDMLHGAPPIYMMRDAETFFVIRFIAPIIFLSAKSFLITTVFMAWFAHSGIWRLFLVFNHYFPKYHKQLAFAILFFPSVVFWGSGIMKDTITISAAGWFTYSVFLIFIKKKKIKLGIIAIIIASYLILSVKPFVLIALLPGTVIWVMFYRIKSIKNKVIRVLVAPALIVFFAAAGMFIMSQLSSSMGAYSSLDSILEKAVITQQDLIREEAYGEGAYNIGLFEPTLAGIAPKFPVAVIAGLFRPFPWEARNFFMMVSALENIMLILLVLFCFIRVGILKFFILIFEEPLLLFSFIFAIFFAFSVGLTSANFGALVRYKIPLLPFFVGTLFVTLNKVKEVYAERKAAKDEQQT